MRIIAGKFKGKKLFLPKDKNTRPLKDIVKESIFNLLKHSKKINVELENSTVLDLFSGSGSFGIECLSRGADSAYFFENYQEAIKILKKNLFSLKEKQNYKIFEEDCFEFLNSENVIDEKFDLIFIDPPYKELKVNTLIEKIIVKKILKTNGVIIIHRHRKDKLKITKKIKILDERNYGASKVYFAS
tara:strand:- start:132 stop:692 length:561 start_codon:yes stop_codon:yes gene_type:complete